jgi:EAL domain-containing protein (putative c-di-GMP-specific phosphodiesterase class I)
MAVIALAHALGLNVVAEGIENDVQLRILQELGCDEIQGFLMSRPMPSSHVLEFVSDHRSCSPAAAVSELQQAAL